MIQFITVETNASPEYYHAQNFVVGSQVMLFLCKKGSNYRLFSDSYCNFKIENGYVEGCDVSKDEFIDEIKQVLNKEDHQFSLRYPSYYMNDKKTSAVSKIASVVTHTIDGFEFRADDDVTAQSRTITFEVNPSNAKDANGDAIPDTTLFAHVASACSLWNSDNIDDTNISFTVDTSFVSSRTKSTTDGHNVIYFDYALPDGGAVCSYVNDDPGVSDIGFDADWYWVLRGQDDGDSTAPFLKTLAHEMGHAVGLGDLGIDEGDLEPYSNNLMWHSSEYMDWELWEPQNGDKAGAVYVVPNPSGTTSFHEIWSGYSNSSDPLVITSSITVDDGDTLIIEAGDEVQFDAGVEINVEGVLVLEAGAILTKSGATNWAGIDLMSGGVLKVDGANPYIKYATCGIDMYGGTIDTGENTLRILGCSTAGIAINSTAGSPTVRRIYLRDCEGTYGGILKSGTTNSPILLRNQTYNTYYSLYIAGPASVDSCYFRGEIESDVVKYAASSTVNFNGYNIIDPREVYSRKAIDNRADTVTDARNNWWGTVNVTDAYFTFPNYMDYSDSLDGAPSISIVKTTPEYNIREIAENYEIEKRYNSALTKYNEALAAESDPYWRVFHITSMLRVHDKYDQQYDELRTIVKNEMQSAEGYNGAVLRFIKSDIDVREGNYQQAIDDLIRYAELYKDTYMEVEMLGRIAEIYGFYLKDRDKALKYAEKAAAINPGQISLRSAYEAAGIEYDTSMYEDRFLDVIHTYGIPEESEEEVLDETVNSVVVSPNPFNPVTTISYSIVEDGHVTLAVYNLAGQKVATLVDSSMPAGTHHAVFDGSNLASGIYFYRFETKNFASNGKMMIVK